MPRIPVLGGGIVGLTCGVVLSLHGFKVRIMGRNTLLESRALSAIPIASSLPAASVLVHSLSLPSGYQGGLEGSERVFETFNSGLRSDEKVVRRQHHFEVFGDSPGEAPEDLYKEVIILDDLPVGDQQSLRKAFAGDEPLFGWRLEVTFVEYPLYVERLRRLARYLNVSWEQGVVGANTLSEDRADGFVNCLGAEGHKLLDDDPLRNGLIEGVVLLDRSVTISSIRGRLGVFSFNALVPNGPCPHFNPDGTPTDLYCYPRRDCFVLGGTRQVVSRTSAEAIHPFVGSSLCAVNAGPERVPGTLIRGHSRLLPDLYGVPLSSNARKVRRGYRPVRFGKGNRVAEPRIEVATGGLRPVVHAYGFGGAGLTLSWWTGARVSRVLETALGMGRGVGMETDRLARVEEVLARILPKSESSIPNFFW